MPLDNLVHKSRVCWLRTKLSRYFAFNEYGWPATVTPKKRLRMEKKQQHQATASTVDGGDKTFHRKIPLRATRLSYLHFLFKIHIFFFFIWLQRRFLHSLSSSIERIQLNGEFVFACVCVCAAFLHSVWEAFKIFKGHHFFSAFPVERAVVASSSQHQWSYNYTYTKHTCEKKNSKSFICATQSLRSVFLSLPFALPLSALYSFISISIHIYIFPCSIGFIWTLSHSLAAAVDSSGGLLALRSRHTKDTGTISIHTTQKVLPAIRCIFIGNFVQSNICE